MTVRSGWDLTFCDMLYSYTHFMPFLRHKRISINLAKTFSCFVVWWFSLGNFEIVTNDFSYLLYLLSSSFLGHKTLETEENFEVFDTYIIPNSETGFQNGFDASKTNSRAGIYLIFGRLTLKSLFKLKPKIGIQNSTSQQRFWTILYEMAWLYYGIDVDVLLILL